MITSILSRAHFEHTFLAVGRDWLGVAVLLLLCCERLPICTNSSASESLWFELFVSMFLSQMGDAKRVKEPQLNQLAQMYGF